MVDMTHYEIEFHCLLVQNADNIAQLSLGAYISEVLFFTQPMTARTQVNNPYSPALRAPSTALFPPKEFQEVARFLPEQVVGASSSQPVRSERGKENVTPSAPTCVPRSTGPAGRVCVVTPFYGVTGDNSRGSHCSSRDVVATALPSSVRGHIAAPVGTKRRADADPSGYDGYGPAVPVTPIYTAPVVRPSPLRKPRLTKPACAPSSQGPSDAAGSPTAHLDELLQQPLEGDQLYEWDFLHFDCVREDAICSISDGLFD
jgi:hypothetical protein